ncbi:DUF6065 family protein [Brevundimonas sp.]|uniref:DUF6065 family protein n=1 Tax=Brevundimonas sp. TaxID=1871086 RepID=UPI002FCC10E9
MELECYPMHARPCDLVPGRQSRDWMDAFAARHPYRCLPLNMANTTGWEILCPFGFTAEWNGGPSQTDITITPDHPVPDLAHFVTSHFSRGIITMHPQYLFRTPPGWGLIAQGAPNLIKDGIQPLVGVVETDWLPFPFTMNWMFTRPGRVKFAKGEPFCFILPIEHRKLENMQPVIRTLESNPVMRDQFDAWNRARTDFNNRLANHDPEAVKEAWQRYYFKGEVPEDLGTAPETHANKRRLKTPRIG